MRKVKKIAIGVTAVLLGAVSLAGCSMPQKPRREGTAELERPAPQYAVPQNSALTAAGTAKDDAYRVSNVTKRENSPLEGKTFYWLGSSVTYGATSSGESMADYLAALTGCVCKKEAVSGTTLYDDGGTGDSGARSYTRRLKNTAVFDKTKRIDAFICQISTNDCTDARLARRGQKTADDVSDKSAFDLSTTLGGVEFVIAYVTETWHCPVYFYSGAYFTDGTNKLNRENGNPKGSEYGKLVNEVKEICRKWNAYEGYRVDVIDLYGDQDFNAVASSAYYDWAMNDPIHPKNAGYLQWWTPYFESYLIFETAGA